MDQTLPNIRHLAAFVAVLEHGSATSAALAVNLTQPALTQAIARLEAKLGCRLFDREPSGMRPTEPARLLGPRVRTAIERIGSHRVTAAQIRAFMALAKYGSYNAASQNIGLAPASLHRAVGDLSLALDERLVERRGRHLSLTRKGEIRARNFGLALSELRSGIAEVGTWLGTASGKIVIGAMPLSRARWLPRAILEFQKVHPAVDLTVVEGSYAELVNPLRNGEIDFLLGALREEEAGDDLLQEEAFIDRPKIIMRSAHPLASARGGQTSGLGEYAWVLPAPNTPLYQYWAEMMQASGLEGRIGLECGSVLTIRELLLETDMLTLLSTDQLRVEIDAGLLVPREPPALVSRRIGMTQRLDWKPTSTQAAMLAILKDEGKHLS